MYILLIKDLKSACFVEDLDYFRCMLQNIVFNYVTEFKKKMISSPECELEQPSSELYVVRILCSFGRI
jgi:hypothetical protein